MAIFVQLHLQQVHIMRRCSGFTLVTATKEYELIYSRPMGIVKFQEELENVTQMQIVSAQRFLVETIIEQTNFAKSPSLSQSTSFQARHGRWNVLYTIMMVFTSTVVGIVTGNMYHQHCIQDRKLNGTVMNTFKWQDGNCASQKKQTWKSRKLNWSK